MTTAIVDVNPPYDFPGYPITKFRAPHQDMIELPGAWFGGIAGPSPAAIPVHIGDNDLVHQHSGEPIGQHVILFGRVLDRHGRPVPNALIEIWQTNGAGRYVDSCDLGIMPVDPNFTGRGRCVTNEAGEYRFLTIKPVPYPGMRGGRFRPAHIHASVFGPDLASRLITQCYFPDDPLLPTDWITTSVTDPRATARMIGQFRGEMMEPGDVDSALGYEWDLVLRGSVAGAGGTPGGGVTDIGVVSPSQTIGPLYGFALMYEGCDVPGAGIAGDEFRIQGHVWDGAGQPVITPGALLEFWAGEQFVRARTDGSGVYRATIRKPSAQKLPDGWVALAPHLNVTIFAQGLLKQVQTRMFFSDEADANAADPILGAVPAPRRGTLIAESSGPGELRFDIRLQGEGETAFFAF